MAEILDIADAMVTALDGHAFAAPYASLGAARRYVPVYDLTQLTGLVVSVIPHGLGLTVPAKVEARNYTRSMNYTLDVEFQMRVPNLDAATLDGLMGLVESVGDFLLQTAGPLTLPSGKLATPFTMEGETVYDPMELDKEQLFESVLRIMYRTWR